MKNKMLIIILGITFFITEQNFAISHIDRLETNDYIVFEVRRMAEFIELESQGLDEESMEYLVKLEEYLNKDEVLRVVGLLDGSYKNDDYNAGKIYLTYRIDTSLETLLEALNLEDSLSDDILSQTWYFPRRNGDTLLGVNRIEKRGDNFRHSFIQHNDKKYFDFYFSNEKFYDAIEGKVKGSIKNFRKIEVEKFGRIYYYESENGKYIIPVARFVAEYGLTSYQIYEANEVIEKIIKKRKSTRIFNTVYDKSHYVILTFMTITIKVIARV